MRIITFVLFFTCLLSKAQNPVCLNPASYSTVPLYGVYPIISGDFNNDSYLDLVNLLGGIVVYASLAGNGFQSVYTYTNTVVNMRSMVSRDFNGDGNLDIAVGTDDAQILVFIGGGNGTFAVPTSYTLGGTPNNITSEDFNNDGKYDLAVADFSNNSLFVLKNTGNGVFSNNNYHFLGFNPTGIRSGDFNNDGKIDLAIQHGNYIDLFKNNGNLFFTSFSSIGNATGIEITDINNDGKQDIVSFDSSATVIRVHKGFGNFSFSSSNYSVGAYPTDIALGDMNTDGKLDIITNNFYADYTVLLNAGNGSFNGIYQDTVQVSASMPWGLSVVSHDFNNDGRTDLLFGYDNGEPAHVLHNCAPVSLIENESAYNTTFYPNPADSEFEIKVADAACSEVSLVISSEVGQIIHEEKILLKEQQATVNTANLSSGLYIATLRFGSGRVTTKKLLITH